MFVAELNDFPWHELARRSPRATALTSGDFSLSWQQLDRQLTMLAAGFQQQGVRPGHCVMLRTKNSVAAVLAYLALLQTGARVLPVNPQLPQPLLADLQQRIVADAMVNLADPTVLPLSSLVLQSVTAIDAGDWQPYSVATLTLTSGSGGKPKAAAHTFAAHLDSARSVNALMSFSADERWLLSLPLFHVSGQAIIWRWLLAGAALVVAPEDGLSVGLRLATFASLVPTQLWRLLQQLPLPKGLKAVLLGGAVIPPELVAQAEASGIRCWCGYGMTETASTVCGKRADGRPGVGGPLSLREVSLVDEEIWLRSPSLASGYWQQGQLLPLTDENGWLHTRDRGRWHDGELQICGRMDNLFFSGGEGIQPEEIERILLQHPDVSQAFILPQDDAEFGQRPVALVECGPHLTLPVLAAWASLHLAGFQRPVNWYNLPAGVADGGIKISRHQLQHWLTAPLYD